jgi:hypothetical protein
MRVFQVSLPHFYQIDGRDQAAVMGQLVSLFAGPLQHCRFLTFVMPGQPGNGWSGSGGGWP